MDLPGRTRTVLEPLHIGGTTTVRNRLYRAPVLEGAGDGDDAAEGLCRYSNLCVPAQMLGMKGACYNPDVVRASRA